MLSNETTPQVISKEMLAQAIESQLSPKVAEIVKQEGVDANDILALRLDYKSK